MNNKTIITETFSRAQVLADPRWDDLRNEAHENMVEIITMIDLDRYWRTLERRTRLHSYWKRLVRDHGDDLRARLVLQDELQNYCEWVVERHLAWKAEVKAERALARKAKVKAERVA